MDIVDSLKPYITMVILETENGSSSYNALSNIHKYLNEFVSQNIENVIAITEDSVIHTVNTSDIEQITNDCVFHVSYYTIQKTPGWVKSDLLPPNARFPYENINQEKFLERLTTNQPEEVFKDLFFNVINTTLFEYSRHLLLIITYKKYLGIITTQGTVKKKIVEDICTGISKLINLSFHPISSDQLIKTFMRGETKNFWLEGLHKPVPEKADKKNLVGPDLRYAIDYLSDQSFTFSSFITTPNFFRNISKSIGVNVHNNSIWIGPSKDFSDFQKKVIAIFKAIESDWTWESFSFDESKDAYKQMPILSHMLDTQNTDLISAPFEVYLIPEFEHNPGAIDSEDQYYQNIDTLWDDYGYFEFLSETSDGGILAKAFYKGKPLVTLCIEKPKYLQTVYKTHYSIKKYHIEKSDNHLLVFDEIIGKINQSLAIRYNSGHIYWRNQYYTLQYNEVKFLDIEWKDFSIENIDISIEKPVRQNANNKSIFYPKHVGHHKDNSLFTYTVNNFKKFIKGNNWALICDDGSHEIADFIGVDIEYQRVYLIHIKASKNNNKDRPVAVGDFEVVVSQAIKNIFLTQQNQLLDILNKRVDIHPDLIWSSSSAIKNRKDIIRLIQSWGKNSNSTIMIIQPRICKNHWYGEHTQHKDISRAHYQLSTLLCVTKSKCNGMGIKFRLLGAKG